MAGPLPWIRVSAFRAVGAEPLPLGTLGSVLMSFSPELGWTVGEEIAFGSGIGFWFLASCSALAADLSARLSSLLSPHPAANSATTSATASTGRRGCFILGIERDIVPTRAPRWRTP